MSGVRVLLLAGTREARTLAGAIAGMTGVSLVASLAGVTAAPAAYPCPVRIGGFGGVDGLARYLREERIAALIDATHPFATAISAHAVAAARRAGVRLMVLDRPPWRPSVGDDWQDVVDTSAAAAALPSKARAFLAIGRKSLADFAGRDDVWFAARVVDPPAAPLPLPHGRFVVARPPFSVKDEVELFRALSVTHLVARNAGGTVGRAKLDAARSLGLPVVMIARPSLPSDMSAASEAEICGWLEDIVAGTRSVGELE